jgi:hypothetical protein
MSLCTHNPTPSSGPARGTAASPLALTPRTIADEPLGG